MSMCGDGVVGPGSQHQSPLFPDVQPGFDPVMGVGGSNPEEVQWSRVAPRPLVCIHQGVPVSDHAKGFHILGNITEIIPSLVQVQEWMERLNLRSFARVSSCTLRS